jgi:transcriptional regulator with XRE-family HTH domain
MGQTGIASILGVSFQQIQKYEKGMNRVSAARLFDICKVLNVPLSSMLNVIRRLDARDRLSI